jgi:hypothetical protein
LKPHLLCSALATTALILSACSSPKVLQPPRVDLGSYGTLGIVSFSSNATGELPGYATRRFLQRVQAAQPGVRVLELGNETRVLSAVRHQILDFEAMRAIGEKWGVDAVFAGNLDVTDVKPNVQLASIIKSMSMSADVKATLSTRLVETKSGATVWTRASTAQAQVAHVSVVSHGPIDFGAQDPDEAYGKLVHSLVSRVTSDFWSHWVKQ